MQWKIQEFKKKRGGSSSIFFKRGGGGVQLLIPGNLYGEKKSSQKKGDPLDLPLLVL
jgi:hypothetical protein